MTNLLIVGARLLAVDAVAVRAGDVVDAVLAGRPERQVAVARVAGQADGARSAAVAVFANLAGLFLTGSCRCAAASPWHAWHMLPALVTLRAMRREVDRVPLGFVAVGADRPVRPAALRECRHRQQRRGQERRNGGQELHSHGCPFRHQVQARGAAPSAVLTPTGGIRGGRDLPESALSPALQKVGAGRSARLSLAVLSTPAAGFAASAAFSSCSRVAPPLLWQVNRVFLQVLPNISAPRQQRVNRTGQTRMQLLRAGA